MGFNLIQVVKYGLFIVFTFVLSFFFLKNDFDTSGDNSYIVINKIYSDGQHNAFPSLLTHNDALLIAFRTSDGHMHHNGSVSIIKKNVLNNSWKDIVNISVAGKDARDPKLSMMPNGTILLLFSLHTWSEQNTIVKTETYYSFGEKSLFNYKFSLPKPVRYDFASNEISETKWLWDLTWHNNTAFGVLYTSNSNKVRLMKSEDGFNYKEIGEIKVSTGEKINEASIVFKGNNLVGVVRNNVGNGYLFTSKPPFSKFKIDQIDIPLGGPNLSITREGLLLLTRFWEKQPHRYTALGFLTDKKFIPKFRLPSYGDTGYGDMIVKNDYILVTYYSTGKLDENVSSDIYLVKIPMDALYDK